MCGELNDLFEHSKGSLSSFSENHRRNRYRFRFRQAPRSATRAQPLSLCYCAKQVTQCEKLGHLSIELGMPSGCSLVSSRRSVLFVSLLQIAMSAGLVKISSTRFGATLNACTKYFLGRQPHTLLDGRRNVSASPGGSHRPFRCILEDERPWISAPSHPCSIQMPM